MIFLKIIFKFCAHLNNVIQKCDTIWTITYLGKNKNLFLQNIEALILILSSLCNYYVTYVWKLKGQNTTEIKIGEHILGSKQLF